MRLTASAATARSVSTGPTETSDGSEASLLELSNADLDELFRSSTSGEIPDGMLRGTVLFWPGTRACGILARIACLLLWQGKAVDRERCMLLNVVTPLRIRSVKAEVSLAPSWVDARPSVLIDYSRTSLVARKVRDEIRLVGPGVYLGIAWFLRRRVAWFVLRQP